MPDAVQNHKTITKDNSSELSDSSDADDEAKQNLELQTLELQLSNEPSNCEAQVQYVKVLRKMGETEKLRLAREAMNEIFPLNPAICLSLFGVIT